MANGGDPDQTAPSVWSGSTLLALTSVQIQKLRSITKFSDRQVWVNCGLEGAIWSGSTLFAIPSASTLLPQYSKVQTHLSCLKTKPTNWYVHPAKTQISLGICPVWSETLLCIQWEAKDPRFLHADSDDSDQTGRMPRLIWVFVGRTCHFVGFVTRRLIFQILG